MGRVQALVLSAMLAALSLSGCLGLLDSEDGSGLESQAEFSDRSGGIEGVVTDASVQPVRNATVHLYPGSDVTWTAADGSFAFSNLKPDIYTVNITKEGFLPTEKRVEADESEAARVNVQLAHVPDVTPYMQENKVEGFMECGAAAGAPGVARFRAPVCSLVAAAAPSATNHEVTFRFPMDPNPWQIITEIDWSPTTAAARVLETLIGPTNLTNDPKTQYGTDINQSPIVVDTDRKRIAEVIQNASAVCNGTRSPQNPSSTPAQTYCNRDVVQDGGLTQIDVQAERNQGVIGIHAQQVFTIYQTLFYHAPACEEYSITRDNRCPQQAPPPQHDPYERMIGNGTSPNNSSR